MNDVKLQHTNAEIIEIIGLIEESNQTNTEKYQTIKPLLGRLNLYCDECCLKPEKYAELFSIPLDLITGTIYEEESDILFLLLKRNGYLYAYDIKNKLQLTYVTRKRYKHSISITLCIIVSEEKLRTI